MKKNITLIICLLCFGQMLMAQELLKPFYEHNNHLYGLKDKNGNVVVEPKYTSIEDLNVSINGGYMVIKLENQEGLIDGRTGKEIIPLKYDHINSHFKSSIVGVELNQKYGAVDIKTGKEVVPLIYDYAYYVSDGLADISLNKKHGLFDITNGKEIVAPKYDKIDYYYNGVAITTIGMRSPPMKYGLINVKTGEEIVAPKYDYIYRSKDTVSVELNKKHGLVEWKTGKEIVAPKYEKSIGAFNSDGFADVISTDLRHGLINRKGEEVLPCVYIREVERLNGNGLYKTNKYDKYDKYGLVSLKGQVKEILPPVYNKIEYYNDDLIAVDSGGYYSKVWTSIINRKGEEIIPPGKWKTFKILNILLGLVTGELKETGKWGIYDVTNKKEILPFKYDEINAFDINGTAMVKLNGKWGAVNKEGKEIASAKYDEVSKFKDGLAEVKIADKYGFINSQWKEVTPVQYDNTYYFDNGNGIKVELNGKWGVVNKEGKEVLPAKYNHIAEFKDGLAKVEIADKYGLINTKFEEVLPVKYNIIGAFNASGLAKIREFNKLGLINTKGKIVAPVQYSFIGGLLRGTDVFFVARNGNRGYMDKSGKEIALEKYMVNTNTDFDFLFEYQCNARNRFSFLNGEKVSVSGRTMTLTSTYHGKTQSSSSVLRLPIAAVSESISNGKKYWTYDFYENESNYESAIVEFHPEISNLMYSITLVSDGKDPIYCNDTKAAAGIE